MTEPPPDYSNDYKGDYSTMENRACCSHLFMFCWPWMNIEGSDYRSHSQAVVRPVVRFKPLKRMTFRPLRLLTTLKDQKKKIEKKGAVAKGYAREAWSRSRTLGDDLEHKVAAR